MTMGRANLTITVVYGESMTRHVVRVVAVEGTLKPARWTLCGMPVKPGKFKRDRIRQVPPIAEGDTVCRVCDSMRKR